MGNHGAFCLYWGMKPQLFIPKPKPVEALQCTGSNWANIEAFMGDCLFRGIPKGDGSLHCIFREWSCDLSPTDWVVKYVGSDVIIIDDEAFAKAYDPA